MTAEPRRWRAVGATVQDEDGFTLAAVLSDALRGTETRSVDGPAIAVLLAASPEMRDALRHVLPLLRSLARYAVDGEVDQAISIVAHALAAADGEAA